MPSTAFEMMMLVNLENQLVLNKRRRHSYDAHQAEVERFFDSRI